MFQHLTHRQLGQRRGLARTGRADQGHGVADFGRQARGPQLRGQQRFSRELRRRQRLGGQSRQQLPGRCARQAQACQFAEQCGALRLAPRVVIPRQRRHLPFEQQAQMAQFGADGVAFAALAAGYGGSQRRRPRLRRPRRRSWSQRRNRLCCLSVIVRGGADFHAADDGLRAQYHRVGALLLAHLPQGAAHVTGLIAFHHHWLSVLRLPQVECGGYRESRSRPAHAVPVRWRA